LIGKYNGPWPTDRGIIDPLGHGAAVLRKDREMMSFITPSRKYHVESHGNGWAYEVTHRESGESFWVQDHDAEQLQRDTDDFTQEDILSEYFEALGE
jgi:hypothetical protein